MVMVMSNSGTAIFRLRLFHFDSSDFRDHCFCTAAEEVEVMERVTLGSALRY